MFQREPGEMSLEGLHRSALGLHSLRSEGAITERLREEAERATGAEQSFVYIVDPKWGELHGVRSAEEGEVRFGQGEGIVGWVVENREVWNCEAAGEDPLYSDRIDSPPDFGVETILAAPIVVSVGDCLGVLMLLNRTEGPFTEDDELFTALLCEHAAAAITSARKFESAEGFSKSLATAVAAAVDAKSVSTVDHSLRVTELALGLGRAMGLPEKELKQLEYAAILHDVGRIDLASLPGAKPGEPGSIERLRNHIFFTDAVLRRIEFPEELGDVRAVAVAHHESIDGSGYPGGLKDDEISLAARILQVATIQ